MNCDDDQIVACLSQEDNEPQELGYHEIGSVGISAGLALFHFPTTLNVVGVLIAL